MKKRILLITAISALAYVSLTSYQAGPAASGQNRTGAKSSGTNCSTGGCHGSAATTSVAIVVDSSGTPVTKYKPLKTYTIKISGGNTASLTKFGFQYTVVSGTGTAQVPAGSCSGFSGSIANHVFSGLNIVEQTATLSPLSAGTSFQWTAPAAGTGNVTMYCTLNAVDGNGNDGSPDASANTSVVLTELPATTAVASLPADMSIKAFPNPAINNVTLQLNNAQTGNYNVEVFNLGGKVIATEHITVNSSSQSTGINTANWASGTYMISVEKDGARNVIPVVKQ